MEEHKHKQVQTDQADMEGHLDEHNYDGIQELDNPPPRWIMLIFYITIGFSILRFLKHTLFCTNPASGSITPCRD